MDMNDRNRIVLPIVLIVVVDVIVFLGGNYIGLFQILNISNDNIYSVDNAKLIGVVAVTFFNIITIYHNVLNFMLNGQREKIVDSVHQYVDKIDQKGKISGDVVSVKDGLKKIEVHLINYDCNTIAFRYLSAIETQIGISEQNIHNEVWVLTNNFEEVKSTPEGCKLRDAIIKNLCNRVDYYYIIPSSCEKEIKELGVRLNSDDNENVKSYNGVFKYIVDDALDFIPTPYFDIVMYLKLSDSGYREDGAQIYYCFSRKQSSDDCFYLQVIEPDIRKNMIDGTEEYKQKHKKKFKYLVNNRTESHCCTEF